MSNKNTSSYLGNSRAESQFHQNFKKFVNDHLHSVEPTTSIFEIARAPLFIPARPVSMQEYLDSVSQSVLDQNLENIAVVQVEILAHSKKKKKHHIANTKPQKKDNIKIQDLERSGEKEGLPQKIILIDSDVEDQTAAVEMEQNPQKNSKSNERENNLKPSDNLGINVAGFNQHKSEPVMANKSFDEGDEDPSRIKSNSNREVAQKFAEDPGAQSQGVVLKQKQSPMKRQTTLTPKDQLNAETIEEEPDQSESASVQHTVKRIYPGDESEFTDDQIDADLMKNNDLESQEENKKGVKPISANSDDDSEDTDDMIEMQLRQNDEDGVKVKVSDSEHQANKTEEERQRMQDLILRLKENEESNRKATEFKRKRQEAKEKKTLLAQQTKQDKNHEKNLVQDPKQPKTEQSAGDKKSEPQMQIVVGQHDTAPPAVVALPGANLLPPEESSYNETDDEIAADLAKNINGSVRPKSQNSGEPSRMQSPKFELEQKDSEGSSNLLPVSAGKNFGRTNTNVQEKSGTNLNKSATSHNQKMGIQREDTFYRSDTIANNTVEKMDTLIDNKKTSTLGLGHNDDNEKFSLGDSGSGSSEVRSERSQSDELEDDEGPLKPSDLVKKNPTSPPGVNNQLIEEMAHQSDDLSDGPGNVSKKSDRLGTGLSANPNANLFVKQKSFVRQHTQKEGETDKPIITTEPKNPKEATKQKTMSLIDEKISEEDNSSIKKQSTYHKFSKKASGIGSGYLEGSSERQPITPPVIAQREKQPLVEERKSKENEDKTQSNPQISSEVQNITKSKESETKTRPNPEVSQKTQSLAKAKESKDNFKNSPTNSPKVQPKVKAKEDSFIIEKGETSTLLKQLEQQSKVVLRPKEQKKRPSNDPFRAAQKAVAQQQNPAVKIAQIQETDKIPEDTDVSIARKKQIKIKPLFEDSKGQASREVKNQNSSRDKRNLEKSLHDNLNHSKLKNQTPSESVHTNELAEGKQKRVYLATLTNSLTAQVQNKRIPRPQQRLISNNIGQLESPYDLSHSNNILRAGFRVEVVIPQNESMKIYPSKYKIRRLKTKELNRDAYVSDRNGGKDDFLRTNFVPFRQIDEKEKLVRMKQLSRISELTQSNLGKSSLSPQHSSLKFGYKFEGQHSKKSNPQLKNVKPFDVRKMNVDPSNRNNYLSKWNPKSI